MSTAFPFLLLFISELGTAHLPTPKISSDPVALTPMMSPTFRSALDGGPARPGVMRSAPEIKRVTTGGWVVMVGINGG